MFDCIYKPIVFFSGSKVMEIKKNKNTVAVSSAGTKPQAFLLGKQ